MQKLKIAFVVLGLCSISACYYDNLEELHVADTPCTVPDTSTYSLHVAPIMSSSCGVANAGCHESSSTENGHVGLANYSDVKDAVTKGMMDAINHTGGLSPMPKGGGKLSDCHIETIQKWIDQGTLNN